ncbi:agamous-like MADS-box protein AGL11 [Macadamia integrifolia]|uniref:agamous-like MADS-box protein AGL11 n=1 Tax=Macadamia integrifolia TaxID=60698 RepID=UPI001C4EAE22|nr:agamous-like MADS-box protein AGL11 [Macadamia integrifolia]
MYSSIKSTIERYKKVSTDNSTITSVAEANAQYYQQEATKLRQQIQILTNANRHLMGDSLSSLTVKELKQLENRLERGMTRIRSKKHELLFSEIEFMQKREMELQNENMYLRTKIAENERAQQANLVTGQEFEPIQSYDSRNYYQVNMLEGGPAYSHPDQSQTALNLGVIE